MLIFISVVTGLAMQSAMGSQGSKNAELAKYIGSIEQSILRKGQPSNVKDKYKRSIERATQLIKQGADVNTRGPNHGITLLMIAVLLNLENLVRRLLETPGINVNLQAVNDEGKTAESALMLAVHRAQPNMVKLLLNAGADTTLKSQNWGSDDGGTAEDLLKDPRYIYEEPAGTESYISTYEGGELDSQSREALEMLKKSDPTAKVITIPISDRKVKAKKAISELLQNAKAAKRK